MFRNTVTCVGVLMLLAVTMTCHTTHAMDPLPTLKRVLAGEVLTPEQLSGVDFRSIRLADLVKATSSWAQTASLLASAASNLPSSLTSANSVGDSAARGVGGSRASAAYPYFRFIPPFVAGARADAAVLHFEGNCFPHVSAHLAQQSASPADGANVPTFTLTLTTAGSKKSLLCSEMLLLASMTGVSLQVIDSAKTVALDFTPPENMWGAAMQHDLSAKGVRVFRFVDDLLTTISEVTATLQLFESEGTQGVTPAVAAANVKFLTEYAHYKVEPRAQNHVDIEPSLVHSGDFFGIRRLDGLDPMLAWAMGSSTGHTAVALRMNGTLYVTESTVNDSYWPVNGIQKTPFTKWVQQVRDANMSMVWAPLQQKYRQMFDESSAARHFLQVQGFDYGYFNMFYGWIDIIGAGGNLPCLPPYPEGHPRATDEQVCLAWQHVEVLFGLVDRWVPSLADQFVKQAFNHRIRQLSDGKARDYPDTVVDILYQSEVVYGQKPGQIATMVEQDGWAYNTTRYGKPARGPSYVCCVHVCNMWKAAGLFGALGSQINCAEFTDWDAFAMDFLEVSPERPSQCMAADPSNPHCQLSGAYTLFLNEYGTKKAYPHMAEHCPSQPPLYKRPADC